jgi:hypothetical protein
MVELGFASVRVLAAHALPVQLDPQLMHVQRSPQALGLRRALRTSGHRAPRLRFKLPALGRSDLEPPIGIEPMTYSLRVNRSAD